MWCGSVGCENSGLFFQKLCISIPALDSGATYHLSYMLDVLQAHLAVGRTDFIHEHRHTTLHQSSMICFPQVVQGLQCHEVSIISHCPHSNQWQGLPKCVLPIQYSQHMPCHASPKHTAHSAWIVPNLAAGTQPLLLSAH